MSVFLDVELTAASVMSTIVQVAVPQLRLESICDCSRLLSLGDLMPWKMPMSLTKEIYTKQWNTLNESFMNTLIREGPKQKPVEYWQQSKRRCKNAKNKNIGSYWKYYSYTGTAVAKWLRRCATNRKVAGSIPDGVIGIFHWHNTSDRTMALGST